MNIGTLKTHCINIIIQQFSTTRLSASFQYQLKQHAILEVLCHEVLCALVDRYPQLVTDDVLQLLCHPSLQNLNLQRCKNVSLTGLGSVICERCPNITALDLSECDQLMCVDLLKFLKGKASQLVSLKLDNCAALTDEILQDVLFIDGLKEISFDTCSGIRHPISSHMFYRTIKPYKLGQHLTMVNLSGCRNLSSHFIFYLTAATQSNLKSINISWTDIDCMALVYLAGYTLSSAVLVNNESSLYAVEQAELSKLLEPQHQLLASDEEDEMNATESDVIEATICGTPERSVSTYLKQVCAYCTQDLAMRQQSSSSTFDVYTESFEDYEVIDSQVLRTFENDKSLVTNCADAAKELHLEWDILSVDDINLYGGFDQCTCSAPTSPLCCNSIDSQANKDTLSRKSSFKRDASSFKMLFTPNITHLDITQIDFYDFEIGKICLELFFKSNPKLEQFHTSWQELNHDILQNVVKNATELVHISLTDCERVENDDILQLSHYCRKLKAIDLKGVSFVNDQALQNLIGNNTGIQYLSLAESAMTDVVLKKIADSLAGTLHTLDLSWCENITNDGVVYVLSSCEKLRALDLRQCVVSVETVNAITKYGTNLISLGLCGIKGLNDPCCQVMVKSLPHLRKIDLSWNSSLTDDSITSLFDHCSCLHEVTVAGLKRITSKPFLPIISGLGKWRSTRDSIVCRLKLQIPMDRTTRGRIKDFSSFEVLEPEFYLPFRSVNYVPELRKLTLGYCDKVNDNHLAEIVAVCRKTLIIEDYYGETIKAKWADFSMKIDEESVF